MGVFKKMLLVKNAMWKLKSFPNYDISNDYITQVFHFVEYFKETGDN